MMKKWMVYNHRIPEEVAKMEIPSFYKTLLVNRGLDSVEKIQYFLETGLEDLHDPFLMADMEVGVDLLLEAIDKGKHIHIIGDYDQDGNSAVVTLIKGLEKFTDRLTYAVPDRIEDGYGINKIMVDKAAEGGAQLIITVDNGISSFDTVTYARKKGIDILITDHHQVTVEDGKQKLPPANGVINPHRQDCPYPFKELCGAGVAYKLISALYLALGYDLADTYELLQFVAMGTICDIVDLVDENRIIVKEGLRGLNESSNPGIRALIEENSIHKEVGVYEVGFVLGPCINASGRLSTARLGIELFLEEDEDLVRSYGAELVRLNSERKVLTEEAFESAYGKALAKVKEGRKILIIYLDQAHESIAGIVAGRVKDRFYRPTVVLTKSSEDGILKGSGRSINSYNMYEMFSECRSFLKSFGGHEMACGLSLEADKLEAFEEAVNKGSNLEEDDLIEELTIDLPLSIENLNEGLINDLNKLGPYGKGNPRPVFGDKSINVLNYQVLGQNRNVFKMNLERDNRVFEAISFGDVEKRESYLLEKFGKSAFDSYSPNSDIKLIDLVYYPTINEFNGRRTIQLRILDFR